VSTKITRGARRHLLAIMGRLNNRQRCGLFGFVDDAPRYMLTMRDGVTESARKAARGLAHLIGPGAMTAKEWTSPVATLRSQR
jgi:hypothetical protein